MTRAMGGRVGAVLARRELLLAAGQLAAIAAGLVLHALGRPGAGDALWAASAATTLVPLTVSVARSLLRRDVGVDVIALLAVAAALALDEYLAGAVVALMLAGGNALETAAGRRARRELSALLARAPVSARLRRDGRIEEVPVDDVMPGDTVIVGGGEVVPVDGTVASDGALVDESALTGEPLPVECPRGSPLRSGTVNAGGVVEMVADRPASESAYAAIVRLVRAAEAQRAPFVRLADRYAAVFLPVAIGTAALAWGLSGDPVRGLAVLVVATPCPLILAAPVALLSGVSRAARRGVIVKGSTAIERLGRARTVLLDKTGTLTLGEPGVGAVGAVPPREPAEVLRLAASLEQVSGNVVGRAIVREARARGLRLADPRDVREGAGMGIAGRVDGHDVVAGSARWLRRRGCTAPAGPDGDAARATADGRVLVAVDGAPAGWVELADDVRRDAGGLVARLRAAGARTVAMATGDSGAVAERVARRVGVDRVHADLTPEDKVRLVRELRAAPGAGAVVMVGDGVNDAPALAAADVGIAMGAAGATVSSETADVVIAVDRVDRVADALAIGRRSLRIAVQSVIAGMALSGAAMVAAALGHLPPVAGALLQEGIDVAVILNALRALRG